MVDDSNKPESSASLNENAANQNDSSTPESSAADVEMSQYVACLLYTSPSPRDS